MLKIGISACFFHADPQRAIFKGKTLLYLEQALSHWVMSQGVLCYLIPAPADGSPVKLKDLVAPLDGLVLQGGSDVSPKSYGEEPLKPEWGGDYVRDQYEIALIKEFLAQGKPVLGVCRGAQLINVAFGGTLYQDIATQIPEAINHRNWDIYDQNFHQITLKPGTPLDKMYSGKKSHKVNTIHHQALKDLGKGLIPEATSEPDGLIEAVRLDSQKDYVFAVQWHPEFHDERDASLMSGAPFLKEFLDRARRKSS